MVSDKKMKALLTIAVVVGLLAFVAAISAAEDPAATKQRQAGLNEFFGKNVCDDCHGPNQVFPIMSAREQYLVSGHKTGEHAFYANGEVCKKCHTHEGFMEFLKDGKVDPEKVVKNPSQPGCFTCHDPHTKGDLSLRTSAPLKLVDGSTFDKGKGNLCAICHTIVPKVADVVKPTPAKDVMAHWGGHHGPQADMLIGKNAYEFPGKKYYNSVHSTLTQNSCLDCHMTFPTARYALSPEVGGHSFSIGGEVNEAEKLNTAGCLGKCHTTMKQVTAVNPDTPKAGFWWKQGDAIFDTEAKADFDNDGKVEPLMAEIEGLLNLFVNKNGTGYLQQGDVPFYKKDGTWNWTNSTKERTVQELAVLYNYKFVAEDRSRGIHNAPYAIQVLYDTIQSVDAKFDVSKRDTYKPPEEYKPGAPAEQKK